MDRAGGRGPGRRAAGQPHDLRRPRSVDDLLARGGAARRSPDRTEPDARAFADAFFEDYNHHHRHSGIGYHTPASVHFGTAAEIRAGRAVVLDAAYVAHPERFVGRVPTPPPLPGPAWINKLKPEEETQKIW